MPRRDLRHTLKRAAATLVTHTVSAAVAATRPGLIAQGKEHPSHSRAQSPGELTFVQHWRCPVGKQPSRHTEVTQAAAVKTPAWCSR
jgi:hypothetical protein